MLQGSMLKNVLSRKFGGEFWFAGLMILISLFFAYLGLSTGNGRALVGSLLVAAIYLWRMYDRIQKMRLARLIAENPEVSRIYHSVER
ncbi:hypothetical protein HNP52_002927 [Sphingomonas kyeonggiensis]|uniref:Uncharacterized protein n=1 Tax=Sphingomonas kyeonggiensis TaxID=1268553 RepID=A0A7W7K3Q9_9SPHN|nr:hypothetical protein [Sphingomonas kyeonggiensis]